MTPAPTRPEKTHSNAETQLDNPHWLKMWRDARTEGFHQTTVNPLLVQYWPELHLKKNSRILVPLCGKSLDMLWLSRQDHQVIGIELSPVAVKAFFHENKLKVKKTRNGNFTCWHSGSIVIWCGDFFALRKQQIGKIDTVFDNTALTALPENIRSQYISQLRSLIADDVGIFLLTVEDVAKDSGLSVNQIDQEIHTLYNDYFDITLTHAQRLDTIINGDLPQGFNVDKKVYRMS